jgi:hypothetical protein
VAGAAGFAGVAERSGHGGEVARTCRDGELVESRVGILRCRLEACHVAPHGGQGLGVALVRAGREHLDEGGLERLELGRLRHDRLDVALGVDDALDRAHRGGDLLAVFLALLDHVVLGQSDRRASDHRSGG